VSERPVQGHTSAGGDCVADFYDDGGAVGTRCFNKRICATYPSLDLRTRSQEIVCACRSLGAGEFSQRINAGARYASRHGTEMQSGETARRRRQGIKGARPSVWTRLEDR